MPLLHVCESVAPSFVPQLRIAWTGQLTAVDGLFNFTQSGSTATFQSVLTQMRAGGIPTMPSYGPSNPLPYQLAARALADSNGIVAKISLAELPGASAWLAQQNVPLGLVDLVVDLKHIGAIDVPSYAGYVSNVLNQNAAIVATVRTITLAAAAAPKDHSALQYGANRIARSDWQLWSSARASAPFRLDYGDYLTGHPDLTDPPGVAMRNATVSARYTLDDEWLIIKGRATGGPYGSPMGTQYRAHATVISNDPGFGGIPGLWADGQIVQAAAGAPKMGSRQKWSEFAANRHISLVADRLP